MTLNCVDIWTSVSEVIRQRVSADGYERWFQGVDVISDDGLKLVFRVPNRIHQFFIESNYLRLVQDAASEVLQSPRKIQFVAPGAEGEGPSHAIAGQNKPVFVYKLIVREGIEGAIELLKSRKAALAEALFANSAKTPLDLTEADISALFVPLDYMPDRCAA